MKRIKNQYLLTAFLIMCAIAFMVIFSNDAFAAEKTSEGRKIWDMIMLWVNFGILVFLFIKYAKKPLMNFLHGERQNVEEVIGKINTQVEKARSLMDVEADKLKNIDEHIRKISKGIIKLGEREKEKIIEKAKVAASQMIEDAKKESQYRLAVAKKEFSEEMLNKAVSIAVEKLKKEFTSKDNEKIIDKFASELNISKIDLN